MADIQDLIENLAEDAGVVNPASHPFMLGAKWIGMAAIYLVVSLSASGLRPDWAAEFHSTWFVAEIAALLLVFISTVFSAALLSFPDMHQKRHLAYAPAAAFALFALVIFFAWRADNPPAPLPVHSYQCTLSILVMTLLPAVWTFYFMRHHASTHCGMAGSVALLSAFSVGALWLRLYEVNDSIAHVIEWHYLPMLAIGLLGMHLGRKILKW
jgi:hypothetical protein